MADGVKINLKSDVELGNLHSLPCKIHYNGNAKVEEYFKSVPSEEHSTHVSGCLRGRPLTGKLVTLPTGYTGHLLRSANRQTGSLSSEGNFTGFTYWEWDQTPGSQTDSLLSALDWLHIANSIALVLPDTLHAPVELSAALHSDSAYYSVTDCPLHLLIEPTFLAAFVHRGELSLVSRDGLLDVGTTCCLTPSGFLVISVQRDVYLQLGIERGPAVDINCLNKKSRFLISINLKHPSFKPEKNNYQRVYNRLQCCNLTLSILVAWEPEDPGVCPSSLAQYFSKRGLQTVECELSLEEQRAYDVCLPEIGSEPEELFHWLGLFLLGATQRGRTEESQLEYLCSYEDQLSGSAVGQVLVLRAAGFLSTRRIYRLWQLLSEYLETRSGMPWMALHVHGFEDSPLSWELQPHAFSLFGDNNYTLIADRKGFVRANKVLTPLRL